MRQVGTSSQIGVEDVVAHPQRTETVESLRAQEQLEYEDSAPEPPCTFKCDICGQEGKASGNFHTAKSEHLLIHQEPASADIFLNPQRKRNVKNLHNTDPLTRGIHSSLPIPKLSHDPNTDPHSPVEFREAGLTTRELEQLIDTQYDEDRVRECICLHVIERGQKVKTLPCGHTFHSKCIVSALIDTDSMDPLMCFTHNRFQVLKNYRRASCNKCNEEISRGEFIVSCYSGAECHLQCFHPSLHFPISISQEKYRPDLKDWVDTWNSQFVRKVVPPGPRLHFSMVVNPRLLLECFQYLDLLSVLRCEEVCRLWYTVCSMPELWIQMAVRDFPHIPLEMKDGAHAKSAYIRTDQSVCYECRQICDSDLCPFLRKNLCRKCRMTPRFELVTKTDIMKRYGLNSSWLDRRKLRFISAFGTHQATYQWMLDEKLVGTRRHLKAMVLNVLRERNARPELLAKVELIKAEEWTELQEHEEDADYLTILNFIRKADDGRSKVKQFLRKMT